MRGLSSRLVAACAGITLLMWAAGPARADRYDIQLAGFGTPSGSGPRASVDLNVSGYEALASDLALSLEPRFGGPATSMGGLGFNVGYDVAITDISQHATHWTDAVAHPGSVLAVSQISVRKGLPYSFEVGAFASHIHESNLWGVGLEAKWAFVEGYRYAPDISVGLHVETMLGSRELSLLSTGGQLTISKAFGLGGLVSLTPYAEYAFTYIRASSHLIGTFQPGNIEPNLFVLPDRNIFVHRGVVGLKVTASVVDLGFEAALGKLQTYAIYAGLRF